ncbi:MAG: ADP-ribosylglycohydrolase family protein, partial [Rubrobacteraceae bacterium]
MAEVRQIERYRGALLGLAAGDALGAAVEFQRPGSFKPVEDMDRDTAHGNPPGSWTDDTSMALCLAESLLECGAFDPVDQLERYVRWRRDGHLSSTGSCFDIGFTTSEALNRFQRTGDPRSGPTDPNKAGNGSIMRLAPVPLFFASRPEDAIRYSGESSLTTHGAENAVDGCRYLGAVISGAINGASKEELLSNRYDPTGYWEKYPLAPEIDEVASGSFKKKTEIRGSGYVVRSLEAALWA